MDSESLFEYMNELLSDETISKLLQFNEAAVNNQVILTLLKPVRFLKSDKATAITDKLTRLAAGHPKSQELITQTLLQIRQKEKWERNRWIVVLLITVAICMLIKFVAT